MQTIPAPRRTTCWWILALLHEGYTGESELASILDLARGDLREHLRVIRGATVKRLLDAGMTRHQVATTLGITENEVALHEVAVR